MAVTTLGALKARILFETNQSGTPYEEGVQNAIITAIHYMEQKHPWVFSTAAELTIFEGDNSTNLPADFNQLLTAKYSISNNYYGAPQGFTSMSFSDLNNLFTNTAQASTHPRKYAIYGNQFYVFPHTSADTLITIYYNYKDAIYPSNDYDISVWFDDQTIDCVRNKALEIFYRDTLQSPQIADTYLPIFQDYSNTLSRKNNKRAVYNTLSI